MKTALRQCIGAAIVTAAIASTQASHAGIIGAPGGFIIAPPPSVDDQPAIGGCAAGWNGPLMFGFNERQGVVLAAPVEVDPGGVFIPAGTRVDSHLIFLNPTNGIATNATARWCFDGQIIGVISDENGLLEAASNAQLGRPGTCYPGAFASRGMERTLGDDYTIRGNTISVTMDVTVPGDWIRVITTTTTTSATGITFGIDRPSASDGAPDGFAGIPLEEGQILTVSRPNFRVPNPPGAFPPPPGVLVTAAGLGVVATPAGFAEVDAISYGTDRGEYVEFSVDEWAVGCGAACPGPNAVRAEGATGAQEAAADVFMSGARAGAVGNWKLIDGVQHLGLVEPDVPAAGAPDMGDNLDALDMDTTAPFERIYISLEGQTPDPLEGFAGSGTAAANGVSGADVLVVSACAPFAPVVYATAAQLRLNPVGDDLDALAILDDGDGIYQPAIDRICYSVTRGSAIVGVMDCGGNPISPGDVLTVRAGCAVPEIWVSHAAMGLAATDELDALDLATELVRASVEPAGEGGPGVASRSGRSFIRSIEPNPFHAETEARMDFAVPAGGAEITLAVYDVQGKRVRTLVTGFRAAGDHTERWDGTDDHGARARSGIYFLRYEAPGASETVKLTLLR